jgi:hypothetical protein
MSNIRSLTTIIHSHQTLCIEILVSHDMPLLNTDNEAELYPGETLLNFQNFTSKKAEHWSLDFTFVICADKRLWIDEVSGLKLWCEQKFGQRGDQWEGSGSIWAFSQEAHLNDFLATWQNKIAPSTIPKRQ